jgi:hypothetical protein
VVECHQIGHAADLRQTHQCQAIRRAHDIGLSDDYLKSPMRQLQAGLQAFVVLMFIVAIQAASRGGAVFSIVMAAVAAAGLATVLLGGATMVHALATRIGLFEHTIDGAAPEQTMTALLGPMPPRPAGRPRQPAMAAPAHPRPPAQPRPIVRKRVRGAIGVWRSDK